jgi:hypothetical protein
MCFNFLVPSILWPNKRLIEHKFGIDEGGEIVRCGSFDIRLEVKSTVTLEACSK